MEQSGRGERCCTKRLRRGQMQGYFSQLKPCVVGIEATQGAHYWARVLTAHGHTVRLISPHFVKPYLTEKNDANDAEAICEAVKPAQHALRSGEVDRAAGPSGAAPGTQPDDRLPHPAQRAGLVAELASTVFPTH